MKQTNFLKSMLLLFALIAGSTSVWATLPETPRWVATALSDISDNATVIIISNSTTATNIALPSIATSSSPAKLACTVTTSEGITTITTPAGKTLQDLAWTLKKVTEGYKFYQEGSSTVRLYLSGTSSNTALRVGDDTSDNDKFVLGDSGKLLKVTTATRFVGPYDNNGSDWRTYNTETATNYKGATLTFYVLQTSTDPAINAEDVVIDADATSGEISYTISNPDESTFNAAEKSPGYDWIDNVTKDEVNKKVTFTTTANTGAAREGYITLTYGALSKDVKVTQSAYVEKYNITINDMTNGAVTSDKAKAAEGETVTLTITPATGYDLSTITVTDADDGSVTVSGTGNTRTFTMPGKAVTVDATFTVHVASKGEWGNPYTVDEIIGSSISGDKYVKGYIVGFVSGNASPIKTSGFTSSDNINLAIATTQNPTSTNFKNDDGISSIQLESNIIRVNNNLYSHSELMGKEVLVYGSVESYNSKMGVKKPKLLFVDNVMTLKDFGETTNSDIPGYSEDSNILYYTNSNVTGKNIFKEESSGNCTAKGALKITEGEPLRILSDVTVPSIENARTLSAGDNAYTWYEPYDYTLPVGNTAYVFLGSDGTTLSFTETGSQTLTANTPYLIIAGAAVNGSIDVETTVKATPATDGDGGTQGDWKFIGTYSSMTAAEAAAANMWALGSSNKWHYYLGTDTYGVYPRRCYMINSTNKDGAAKLFDTSFGVNNEATHIELINKQNPDESRIYTLDGRYVGTKKDVLNNGIYVSDGKKFIVK